MQVTYKLESSDIAAFQRYWWRHKSGVKTLRLYIVSGLVVAICWFLLPRDSAWTVISFVAPLVLILSLAPILTTRIRIAQAKSMPDVLSVQTIIISQDYLEKKSDVSESKTRWQGIEDIASDKDLIYLFANKRMAHLVPKRAFHDAAESQIFLETAVACWKSAKAGLPPPIMPPPDTWPPSPRTSI